VSGAAPTLRVGDVEVGRIGFGAARVVGEGAWGPPADRARSVAVLRRAAELGVTFFDTAEGYGPHLSEELVREALHPYRGLLIATKGGLARLAPDVWRCDGRPEALRRAVDGSLRRLGVERIDLYQLHRVDPRVPLAEQVGALAELIAVGKLRAIGLCEVSVAEIEEARRIAPIAAVHNLYHLLDRSAEPELAWCAANRVAFIPWYPLAGGALVADDSPAGPLAGSLGATRAQLALAWLLQRSPFTLPIPGTSSVAHLEENLAARSLTLDGEALAAIDRLCRIQPGF
jgi:pyridoxine 4-dehydrogenase